MKPFRHGLWIVLALALLVRLPPLLFERQITQDAVELQSVAENLRAGHGFILDIKAYWAVPTGVVHYGFYERPILLPALLALLRLALTPLAAAQLIGPLLFLAALALLYRTIEQEVGPEAAFSAGVLLALHPGLFEISLLPLSEATTLFTLALIVWAHFRMRSPILTGIACSLAFLARPSMALFTAILGIVYLFESIRMRRPLRVVVFALAALIGPVWTVMLNRAMGAPLTLLPQSFLFRVRNFADYVHYFHRGELYPSAAAVFHAHRGEIVRQIGKNALYYAKEIVSICGLGALIAMLPIALAGLAQGRPLRRFGLLGLFAAADLGLYTLTWSTFDATRFLSLFYLVALFLIAIGMHEVLDREPLLKSRRAWLSGASYAVLAVSAVWFCIDAGHGYLAFRHWQLGRPIADPLEAVWDAPGVKDLVKKVNDAKAQMNKQEPLPIAATNVPWLVYDQTRLPSGIIPYDLKGGEWTGFIDAMQADLVVVHEGTWPPDYRKNLEDLAAELKKDGWTPWFAQGKILAWMRPLEKKQS